mmetsp:Transcript_103178/g.160872  ORF Transcript_103178/g.160872 Transcript_103178/m.160872 type:complete len:148 (+) Transcript_103178:2-445(+)
MYFAKGDACSRMFFVVEGLLVYKWSKKSPRRSQRPPREWDVRALTSATCLLEDEELLKPKRWLSEAALWIEWENQGELIACQLCSLLALDAGDFMNVVKLFRDAWARAVLYARVFVEQLKKKRLSDVMTPITDYMPTDGLEIVKQTF